MEHYALTHRIFSGWISDFGSLPRQEPWPSITLDKRLMADLSHAFERAESAGYNAVILWGLLCRSSWSSYLPDTVDAERKERVQAVMAEARRRGLKVLMGLGVYSWGFDEIIAHHPELDGGSLRAMCGSRPESRIWMERVVDYVMTEYDPDGVSMQSSDLGRCPCDACQEMSALQYHALLNDQTATYIRSRWPNKLIHINTWGMDLSNPDELPALLQMTAHVDVLNDYNNSSAMRAPAYRQTLIRALRCAFGTESGWWLDPPPFWDRLKWFIPISVRNIPYYRDLFADGADAIERYILPLANPGAEVGFLFDGMALGDIRRDPLNTLAQALDIVFEPRTLAAREALVNLWQMVENAFLDNGRHGRQPQQIGLTGVHYSPLLPATRVVERPEYLLRMKREGLAAYADALRSALTAVTDIRAQLGNRQRTTDLERAIGLALADVQRVLAYKAPAA